MSYTLNKTGAEIDEILQGGVIVQNQISIATNAADSATASASACASAKDTCNTAKATCTSAQTVCTQAANQAQTVKDSIPSSYTALSNEVDELKSDLESLDSSIYTHSDDKIAVKDISGVTKLESFNGSTFTTTAKAGIKFSSHAGYDSYYFVADKDYSIYFDDISTATYIALMYGENFTERTTDSSGSIYLISSNPVRYRKSENNLPTITNKLSVSSGDVIAFTITKNQSVDIYGIAKTNDVKEDFARKVLNYDSNKVCKLKYGAVDTDIGSRGKEQVTFYLPATVGYIKYAFIRNEYDSYNSNNWRIDRAYACDDSLDVRFPITNQGEWEMAIKIDGRSDFIGGNAHGDEVFSSISFFVDGEKVDITALTTVTTFGELRIVELTDMYDPADSATLSTRTQFDIVGKHGREYIITQEGIKLNQFVKWLKEETCTASYMTMFPVIRGNDSVYATQITDKVYSNDDYITCDCSTISGIDETQKPWKWINDVTKASIWSDVSGVFCDVEMLKQTDLIGDANGGKMFKVQSASAYNKLYWSICGVGSANTYHYNVNDRVETSTMYRINVCK